MFDYNRAKRHIACCPWSHPLFQSCWVRSTDEGPVDEAVFNAIGAAMGSYSPTGRLYFPNLAWKLCKK